MRSCRSCKLTTTLRALQQYQSHQPHQPHGPGGQPPRQHFSQKLGVDGRKVSNDSYQKRAVRGGNPAGEQLLQFIAEKVSGCCDLMVVMVVMVVAMTMMMTMMMVMMVVVMMMVVTMMMLLVDAGRGDTTCAPGSVGVSAGESECERARKRAGSGE